LIIYIYGSESFKKEINDLLVHSNIRLRLDDHSEIIDLNTLEELKNAIEDNPNNIYLIDDTKIIKKNSLNKKIKFLKPKDGIEQEYLLDHGIGDISVDSIEELSKHLIRKIESSMSEKEASDIQNSIVEIVEDAYSNEDGENTYQLDEELSALLSHEDIQEPDELHEVEEIESTSNIEDEIEDINNNKDSQSDFNDYDETRLDSILNKKEEVEDSLDNISLSELKDLDFDEDFDNIDNINEKEEIEGNIQGENMADDEFAEFDTLSENDILEALDELDTNKIESSFEVPKVNVQDEIKAPNENLEVNNANINEIANLISKLLNNKTLEITIKVKD
jgi:hypothetical protein